MNRDRLNYWGALARAPPALTCRVLSSAMDFAAHDGWRKTNQ